MGEKLQTILPGKTINYNGGFVYEDGALQYILNEEGRYSVNGVGGVFAQYSSSNNKYQFNGKELQEETDWLDYGFRMYDNRIGRWMCQDPMAEKTHNISHSPYNYCVNNPVNYIDPDGLDWFANVINGDLYYNKNLGLGDVGKGDMMGLEGWMWIGGNNMFSVNEGFYGLFTTDYALLKKYSYYITYGSYSEGEAYFIGSDAISFLEDLSYNLSNYWEHGDVYDMICNAYYSYDGRPLGLAESREGVYISNLLPVATIITGDVDYFVGGGMDSSPYGIVLMLQGPQAGQWRTLSDVGWGLGVDVSASLEQTNLWYTGDLNNFTFKTIEGKRHEVGAALSFVVDLGATASLTTKDRYGGRIIGLGFSVGVGAPFPWLLSGNYNFGETFIHGN